MSVQVENISKYFSSQKALDNINFKLKDGELTGFLGPNGAGKSTLMKIITGYLAPDEGNIFINGQATIPVKYEIRQEVGYLPENNPLYVDLYVKEYLMLSAGFYHLPGRKIKVREVIEMTGLGPEQHKKIKFLSKGYRQRVGLAQALIHNPSVLILDEPTTGLDPNQLEEIRSLIYTISREKTVLFSTHIMQEVEAICQRVLIINKGKLIADSPVELLKNGNLISNQQVFVEFDKPVNLQEISHHIATQRIEEQGVKSFFITAPDQEDLRPALFHFAVAHGLIILTMTEKQTSIEQVFQKLTKENSG